MDPAKQLVTVWNVTICDIVSQLVSKCSESGSVESAIENRFNRQCQTYVTMYFFFPLLTGLAGKVENRNDTMILFTEDTKPFNSLLPEVIFAIYLFKDSLQRVPIQEICINRIKVQRAVLQHSLSKPHTVTPSCDCSRAVWAAVSTIDI